MQNTLVVTGGSRGIGAAIARMAAARGYGVAFSYAGNRAAAEAVARDVEAAGQRVFFQQVDVASDGQVSAFFAAAGDALGTPAAVVANAGIVGPRARFEDLTRERIDRMMAINVGGVFSTCREAVRRMSTRHGGVGGAIVVMSSVASRLGSPFEFVDYAASKGATDSMTIGLAKEVAADGIRVNAVRPGLIYTDIHADAGVPDRVEQLKQNVPMQRGGSADEVAEAALWLLSDHASYVTGTFLDVTGGR